MPSPSARSLLITILGELVYPGSISVLTTTLLTVMRGLGVEDHATRQAISRSAAAGWMTSERSGRAVRWRVAPHGREVIEDGLRRSSAFVQEPASWDGQWLLLLVSVPQEQRTIRKQLYGGLSWLGLGNPTPGVWVTPHVAVEDEVRTLVAGFGLDESAIGFVGSVRDIGMSDEQIVGNAWDLRQLADRYAAFIEQYRDLRPAPGFELLVAHIHVLNLLQRFIRLDPQLPRELQPAWVGRQAAELFRRRREQWTAPARAHWQTMIEHS